MRVNSHSLYELLYIEIRSKWHHYLDSTASCNNKR